MASSNPVTRPIVWLIGVVQLLVTANALRDLRGRPGSEIRGPKWLWVLVCFVQPVGPLAYALVGRRTD